MNAPGGGRFLIAPANPSTIFTPEDLTDEHRMIRDLARQFVHEEVVPRQESIEKQEWEVTVQLLRRCGDLGLIGIEVPERYGGSDLDKVSAMVVVEEMARVASFGVSYGGQAGIGTLPIVHFGSEELKEKYLPDICKGERISAYALSESGSASDALAAKTTAVRTDDGRYWRLRGEKMWITNAAFADVFITFAQVDGRDFTGFVVERRNPGVSTGAEERKMGLKGSSTRPLLLDDAMVPIENLLGDVGKGHRVAFSTLNVGRAKLGATSVGAGKVALHDALQYARERTAFGRPIASFGAIQHKLAEMATRLWVTESMVYRTARLLSGIDPEYAIECSTLKVFGSESLDYVVDEAVQIFGGYGFTSEYPVERYYRDARVNRIFEGTNEINRLLMARMLFKRGILSGSVATTGRLAPARQAFALVANLAAQQHGEAIKDEQEILMHLADIVMEIYAMDSAICRAEKNPSDFHSWIAETFLSDSIARVWRSAVQILSALVEGDTLQTHLGSMHALFAYTPANTVQSRRRIAEYLLDNNWK
ncbi:MAG TPA: acyl-CoA dehydrogenase family protein [Terriglobia bacterium]|nr:acyl-CoA dehydrogenase family protein [Terriglobia bacterium]